MFLCFCSFCTSLLVSPFFPSIVLNLFFSFFPLSPFSLFPFHFLILVFPFFFFFFFFFFLCFLFSLFHFFPFYLFFTFFGRSIHAVLRSFFTLLSVSVVPFVFVASCRDRTLDATCALTTCCTALMLSAQVITSLKRKESFIAEIHLSFFSSFLFLFTFFFFKLFFFLSFT